MDTWSTGTEELKRKMDQMQEEEVQKLKTGHKSGVKGVDTKQLHPGTYKPVLDDVQAWRDWSYKARSYLRKVIDPGIATILEAVQTRSQLKRRTSARSASLMHGTTS